MGQRGALTDSTIGRSGSTGVHYTGTLYTVNGGGGAAAGGAGRRDKADDDCSGALLLPPLPWAAGGEPPSTFARDPCDEQQ